MINRIRAWLIALVREAVRAEIAERIPFNAESNYPKIKARSFVINSSTEVVSGTVVPSKVQPEPSFERMQDEALQEQEKYNAERAIQSAE